MKTKVIIISGILLIAVIALTAYIYFQNFLNSPLISNERIEVLKEDVKNQNEKAFEQFDFMQGTKVPVNKSKNLYFGDLHVHTSESFDAFIFGNRLGMKEAYEFARGKEIYNVSGEKMQISRPLDFVAITDHAETIGLFENCKNPKRSEATQRMCYGMLYPSLSFFADLIEPAFERPPINLPARDSGDTSISMEFTKTAWQKIVRQAELNNVPGEFTTFIGYEYSPSMPGRGRGQEDHMHRNVIFKNGNVPDYPLAFWDAFTAIDLWKKLVDTCRLPCEFLTIPHNSNKSNGKMFSDKTIDNDPYRKEDWLLRDQNEPLVEIFQVKGSSECSLYFGSSDEECNFEQFYPKCEDEDDSYCIRSTSMVRSGLKKGLKLQDDMGFNPLDFGIIASTDMHNSNPGDSEEWDFRNETMNIGASARSRLDSGKPRDVFRVFGEYNPGGLAAIWAEENTRGSLFESMKRKEVYGTSGTRIELRFFASFDYTNYVLNIEEPLDILYKIGHPMGSSIKGEENKTPKFYISAKRDEISAPLDKVQIIKGWNENGNLREEVYDIYCSDDRKIDSESNECEMTKAKVDLSNCSYSENYGDDNIVTLWEDNNYKFDQNAFYYVRVLQNPTCRWSSYDSLRLGIEPLETYEPTVSERAWSSPIWINKN